MDRTVATGAGVAFVGHVALIALLIWLARMAPTPVVPPPEIEVSFEEDVGLVSSAPEAPQTAAPAEGEEAPIPEQAAGADAAVPEEAPPEPEVVTEPTPSVSRDRPEAPRRDARSNQPSTRREVTPPRPQPPRPQQSRPTPPRPTPQRQTPPRQPQRPAATPGQSQRPATTPGRGQGQRSTGSRLPSLGSFGRDPSAPAREARPAATVSAQARASFTALLARQIQRCSSQQRLSASEARSLRPVVSFTLNRDGSLASAPRVLRTEGQDESNSRYVDLANEAIIRAIRSCAPYRGLPAEQYDAPNGWRQPPAIRLTFQ